MAATILLVEDSSTILNLLNLVMRHAGYRVITAADGLEGLARLAEEPVDLIITDINSPPDGLGFIARVRTLRGRTSRASSCSPPRVPSSTANAA